MSVQNFSVSCTIFALFCVLLGHNCLIENGSKVDRQKQGYLYNCTKIVNEKL